MVSDGWHIPHGSLPDMFTPSQIDCCHDSIRRFNDWNNVGYSDAGTGINVGFPQLRENFPPGNKFRSIYLIEPRPIRTFDVEGLALRIEGSATPVCSPLVSGYLYGPLNRGRREEG